jgi:hypothetical protein
MLSEAPNSPAQTPSPPGRDELDALVRASHNPALAGEDGHVYQIWNDGELTSQKAGRLLWQRTLHTLCYPLAPKVSFPMPTVYSHKDGTSYAFVEHDAALQIRSLMARLSGAPDKCVDADIEANAKAAADGLADDPRAFIERLAASNLWKFAAHSQDLRAADEDLRAADEDLRAADEDLRAADEDLRALTL